MSILLEALRKSEKNQHPREVPTIHSGEQADPVREPLKRGPLVLLLVAALVVIGWFIWRQYQPAAGYEPPVTLEATEVKKINEPPAGANETASAAPRNTTGDKPASRNRTPVESYQPADTRTAQVASPHAGPGDDTEPDKPATEASKPRANVQRAAKTRNNRVAKPGKKPAPAAANAGAGQNAAAARKPRVKKEEKRDPRETQPISYWELPDSVRSNVPEIKFSVLVYAKDPADRFVLINGERLGEGDTAQPGLVVKEIRLDGVVFSYKLYQFLVER